MSRSTRFALCLLVCFAAASAKADVFWSSTLPFDDNELASVAFDVSGWKNNTTPQITGGDQGLIKGIESISQESTDSEMWKISFNLASFLTAGDVFNYLSYSLSPGTGSAFSPDLLIKVGVTLNGIEYLDNSGSGSGFLLNQDADGNYAALAGAGSTLDFYFTTKNGNHTDDGFNLAFAFGEAVGGEEAATPEPATMLIFGAGAAGLALARRANSRKRNA